MDGKGVPGRDFRLSALQRGDEADYLKMGLGAWSNKKLGKVVMEKEIARFFRHRKLSEGICLTLKGGKEVVGVAFMVERQHDLDGVDIFNISVKKDYRSRGIGSLMMKLLFEEARKRDKKWAFVSTNEKIAVFYKKCGMKELGRISKPRDDMDRVYLYKKLD
jgi:ribosomal protein S18 acetylase RimI-like enzyme